MPRLFIWSASSLQTCVGCFSSHGLARVDFIRSKDNIMVFGRIPSAGSHCNGYRPIHQCGGRPEEAVCWNSCCAGHYLGYHTENHVTDNVKIQRGYMCRSNERISENWMGCYLSGIVRLTGGLFESVGGKMEEFIHKARLCLKKGVTRSRSLSGRNCNARVSVNVLLWCLTGTRWFGSGSIPMLCNIQLKYRSGLNLSFAYGQRDKEAVSSELLPWRSSFHLSEKFILI